MTKNQRIKIVIISFVIFLGFFCLAKTSQAEIIFQSKWDNPNQNYWNVEDDGGAWHYAYVANGNITLERVADNQSALGGPVSSPPGSNANYFLRETWVPNGQDGMVYLQANFEPQYQNLTDYYGGIWVYFQNGFQFIDSIKFFDFRTEHQAAGNGHLALFGFDHNGMGCGQAVHSSWNAVTNLCGYPNGNNLTVFRYLAGEGQNVSGNEYMFNYYDSPTFDANVDSGGSVISDSGYTVNSPARVCPVGGQWIAYIFHARIHDTDGRYEAWIKKGNESLRKVIDWGRNTVWPVASGPHDFYTKNGTGVDHLQVNAYWNGWPGANGTRRVWLSNVVVATTYDEVANYLGVSAPSDITPPAAPTGVTVS